MRLGCLAWGSLVWDPRTLPRIGEFQLDGPDLPIEFSRVSLDGRVTLVIDVEAPLLRTFWVELDVSTLDEAVEALGRRERIVPERWPDWVGRYQRGSAPPVEPFRALDVWVEDRGLDAVLWTALPSRSPDGQFVRPSYEQQRAHLESLSGEALARAEQYIRRTPMPVKTPWRALFEADLGWTPRDAA